MVENINTICACCIEIFGKRTDKVLKITPGIEKHIQNLIWKEYDVGNECCPKVL